MGGFLGRGGLPGEKSLVDLPRGSLAVPILSATTFESRSAYVGPGYGSRVATRIAAAKTDRSFPALGKEI